MAQANLNEKFLQHVAAGNTQRIKDALQEGAYVNCFDTTGSGFALKIAVERNNVAVAKSLLKRGAAPDLVDAARKSALIVAAEHDKHFAIAKLLIEKGATVNLVDATGKSALMIAAENGCIKILRLLLFHGANVDLMDKKGSTALMMLVRNNDSSRLKFLEMALQLLQHGADVNLKDDTGVTALMVACRESNYLAVDYLLRHGAQVDLQDDSDGRSALMIACQRGTEKELVELLLKHGANTNLKDNNGFTALARLCTIYNGDVEIVRLLLDSGAQMDIQKDGKTPLMLACEKGSDHFVQILLQHKAQVNVEDSLGNSPLTLAYNNGESGGRDCGSLLLDNGAVPTQPLVMRAVAEENEKWMQLLFHSDLLDVNMEDDNGKTLLMSACEMGKMDLVRALLRKEVFVDMQDNRGRTAPMMLKFSKCLLEESDILVVKRLLSLADPNLQDDEGVTFLMRLCEFSESEDLELALHWSEIVIELLQERKPQTNLQDNEGKTVLMRLCEECMAGSAKIVDVLLSQQHGIEEGMDLQDNNGNTALMIACRAMIKGLNQREYISIIERSPEDRLTTREYRECINSLVVKGADLDLQNNEGKTALMMACQQGYHENVAFLLQKGASMNLRDNKGKTALMTACQQGYHKSVAVLLEKGANMSLQDNEEKTALMIACKNGLDRIVQDLLEHKAQVNVRDSQGNSPLTLAYSNGESGGRECGRLLLDNGAVFTRALVMRAVVDKNDKWMHLLFCSDLLDVSMEDDNGKTLLMRACKMGKIDLVQALLRREALTQVYFQDKDGKTALMIACEDGLDRIVQVLLEHKAQVNVEDSLGNSPLTLAYNNGESGGRDCGRLLLDNGAVPTQPLVVRAIAEENEKWMQLLFHSDLLDVNMEDDNGKTLLMSACEMGKMDLVRALLRKEVFVDMQDNRGRTAPMMLKLRKCLLEELDILVVKRLLSLADPNLQDDEGVTCLMRLCEFSESEDLELALHWSEIVIELLQERKPQTNLQDNEGKTVLMRLCEEGMAGSGKIVDVLLSQQRGIEEGMDLQDNNGNTALMIACRAMIKGLNQREYISIIERSPEDRLTTREYRECINSLVVKGADLDLQNSEGKTALLMACQQGYHENVAFLLQKGASMNLRDNKGKTALITACQQGYHESVAVLLEKGANMNLQDNEGKTALIMACQRGHHEIVIILLQKGASMNMRDNEGTTALMTACQQGYHKSVAVLLEKGAIMNLQDNKGKTALMMACRQGYHESVALLLEKGASMNLQDNEGKTALIMACQSVTRLLLARYHEKEASMNPRRKKGTTSLMTACQQRYHESVALLLEKGANLNLQDNDGRTALMMACWQGYHESVALLLEKGAKMNLQDNEGKTALLMACWQGYHESVALLLEKGANLNLQDNEGKTALMVVCRRGYHESVALLLEKGASINLQDDEGKTALIMACQREYHEIVTILLQKGVNMNLQDSKGKTGLMIASQSGWISGIEQLFGRGAKIDVLDNAGMSALTASIENDITVLLKHGARFELQNMGDVAELIRASKEHSIAELTDMILQTGLKITAHPSLMYNGTEIVRVNTDPPLIAASELGDKDGVQQSLQEGAEINSKNSKGRTALITASGNGHTEVADLLLERSAHIDMQDDEGCSALMTACRNGHIQTASLLLDEDADTFLKNNEGKTAFDLAVEGGNAELMPLFTKLRRKPTYPGILFLEGSKRETVTLEEKTIDLKEVGISLTIPENSLPSIDPSLQLEVQPCFSGSFELPQDVELVSPAYIVKSSRDIPFEKEVLVKIWHYANLESEEDCEDMVFLSASTTPEYREDTPVYVFREIEGGLFRPGEEEPVGQIHLKHFCSLALGKRKRARESESDSEEVEPKRRKDDMYSGGLREENETRMDICNDNYAVDNINTGSRLVASLKLSQDNRAIKTVQNHGAGRARGNLYSARLYKTIEKKVIFCICLYQPQYIKNCDKVMSVQYGRAEKKLDTTIFNRVQITSSEVCITQSCTEGWAVVFDREPASILREEVNDQEIFGIADLLDMDYPPKIEIVIQSVPTSPDSGPLCLHVEGLNRESTYIVNQADLGPVDQTPQAVKQVDTAVIKLAVAELKDEIQNQSSSHLSVAPISTTLLPTANEMRVMMEALEQMLQCCSSGDSLHYLVNEMEKKSRLLKEKTGEVLRYIKIRCDMDVSVERANTLALQMKMVYMANMQHWDTPEWQCAVGLFVANAANLMKAIKDTLRASKLAQEIPNNLLISSPGSVSHPSINNLTLFKWEDCNGKVLDFRLLDEVSAGWRQMGLLLGLSMNILESISRDKPNTTEKCQEMFSLWLDRYHHCYPPTWQGLYKLLCDVRKSTVADKMKKALEFHGIQLL